jgi:hypothetical protein
MMVDGAEECQLRGPIDVLAPYSSARTHAPILSVLRTGEPVTGYRLTSRT